MATLGDFRLFQPRTIDDALATRRREPSSRYLAGGTDLLANLVRGIESDGAFIDLRAIPELHAFSLDDTGLTLGAAVTLADLIRDRRVRTAYPALIAAAESVAAPAHREAATIGGNLCASTRCVYYNESDWWREANGFCLKYRGETCHIAPAGTRCWAAYSGDLAPALFAYRADVEIVGTSGTERIPLEQLFVDDGAAHLTLKPDQFIAAVRLPSHPWPAAYEKLRARGAIDFPLVGIAFARHAGRARIGITGTDSSPIMLEIDAGARDTQHLCDLVGKSISPMRTTSASPFYRRRVAIALMRRLAESLP